MKCITFLSFLSNLPTHPQQKKKKKRKKRALLIHRLFSGGKSPEAKRGKRENFRKLE